MLFCIRISNDRRSMIKALCFTSSCNWAFWLLLSGNSTLVSNDSLVKRSSQIGFNRFQIHNRKFVLIQMNLVRNYFYFAQLGRNLNLWVTRIGPWLFHCFQAILVFQFLTLSDSQMNHLIRNHDQVILIGSFWEPFHELVLSFIISSQWEIIVGCKKLPNRHMILFIFYFLLLL